MSYNKYSDSEVADLIASMTVLVDTREQKNSHITDYFDKSGTKYKKKALKYGDYSFYVPANEKLNIPRDIYFDNDIIIERKGSLEELSGNLTKERDRLEKEFALAPNTKVLLIENCDYGDMLNHNYKTEYSSKAFWGSLHTMWHRYNIPVFFMPEKKNSGFFIRGYFTYFLKEYLR